MTYNQPGKGAHYSNTNYKLLGLTNAVFATQPDIRGDHLHGYALLESETIDVTTQPSIWILWASGNMVSNVSSTRDNKKTCRGRL